jgi:hypothetical protein
MGNLAVAPRFSPPNLFPRVLQLIPAYSQPSCPLFVVAQYLIPGKIIVGAVVFEMLDVWFTLFSVSRVFSIVYTIESPLG